MNRETTRPLDSRLAKDAPSTAQNAALRGASLAFGKPPVKPKPQINTYSGNNGALAAATKVGGASTPASRNASLLALEAPGEEQRLAYHRSGGSNASGYAGDLDRVQQRLNQLERGRNGFLNLPGAVHEKSQSTSFIAATLAASRSASVTPNHTGQRQRSSTGLHRQSSFTRRSPGLSPASVRSLSSSRASSEQVLDTSSIPPTTSLIGLFEQNTASRQAVKMETVNRSATTAAVRRPRSSREGEGHPLAARSLSISPVRIKSQKRQIKPSTSTPAEPVQSSPKPIEPTKPHPPSQKPSIPVSKPIPISSKSRLLKAEQDLFYSSSPESFVSASDFKPSFRASLLEQNRRLTSTSAVSVHSSATIDSMANAIVASSLASSRAASPSKSLSTSLYPPPPPPARRSPHKHLLHNNKETSHTPSPPKSGVLRTTMRKQKPEEEMDEGEKRRIKRSHLLKKHPNKHHEGDRKRWRDEITERERKRYEAVWASNKGLYTPAGSQSSVSNLVARDIYSRSRLQTDVLEEVYLLVDRQRNGTLGRQEFVVGLWLIDQWLKGRKLPVKVSDSVWRSVEILRGIKIKSAGK